MDRVKLDVSYTWQVLSDLYTLLPYIVCIRDVPSLWSVFHSVNVDVFNLTNYHNYIISYPLMKRITVN